MSNRFCGTPLNYSASSMISPTSKRQAAATSKAAVIAALAKSLKLAAPETLHFWSDAEKVAVVRRPEKQTTRRAVLRDLTAA
jgi:hypothetical protein